MTVQFDAGTCPRCEKTLDGHTLVTGQIEVRPDPGDIAVCIYCAAVLKFAKDGKLAMMTDPEIDQLDDEELMLISKAVNTVRRMRL